MALSGKLEADFSPFKTAVDETIVKLRSFEEGGSKVEKQLNRVADSLSGRKLVQDALLMSRAVDEIGGVSKLTASELERVGAKAAEAAEKMRALGITVPAQIQKLADTTKTAGGFFSDLTTQVGATALGFISAQAVIGGVQTGIRELTAFVGSSVESYASAEAAAKKMTVALEAQGTATPTVIGQFTALAAQFQQTTVYSDDLITEMQALLTQVGNVGPSQMQKALTAATNLASGLGVDLNTATMLVAKAFAGHTESLGKYGIVLDDAKVKAEGMTYVLDKIQARFGGQAQAELDTYSGKVKQIANDWDNFKEAVGKSVVDDPLVVAALQHAREAIAGTGDAASTSTPMITKFFAELMGGSVAGNVVGFLGSVDLAVQGLAADLNKLKPPEPKAFTDFGADLSALFLEADALTATLVDGWVRADASAEKLFADEQAGIKARNDAWERSTAVFTRLMSDAFALQVQQGGTAQDIERSRILETARLQEEAMRRQGAATAASLALLRENTQKALDGVGVDWELLGTRSIQAAEQARDAALETYNRMAARAGDFTRGELQAQLDKYRELAFAATASGRAMVDAEDAAAAATRKHTDELAKQKKAEDDRRAAAKANREATYAIDYTAPGALDRPATSIEDYVRAFQGNFAAAAAAYQADQAARARAKAALTVSGFSGGGGSTATIGPPAIVPLNAGIGGGTTVVVHMNVSGVFDASSKRALAAAVSDELLTRVKMGRQFGTA